MKLPQLTLRDLFWLVLVAAMGCAWWMAANRRDEKQMRLENSLMHAELKSDNLRETILLMKELLEQSGNPYRVTVDGEQIERKTPAP